MSFRLFGTEIYLSFFFVAFITIMLSTDKTGLILPTLFAVFMHECGHLFMMWLLGCTPKEIRLIPASVQITSAFSGRYKNDVLIALAGPLVNFLLFAVFYYNFLKFQNELVGYFALINLVLGIFNLLPVKGLDGGTLLFSILCRITDINKATLILKLITIILAVAIMVTAVFATVRNKTNISLYIMGIYLIVVSLMKM